VGSCRPVSAKKEKKKAEKRLGGVRRRPGQKENLTKPTRAKRFNQHKKEAKKKPEKTKNSEKKQERKMDRPLESPTSGGGSDAGSRGVVEKTNQHIVLGCKQKKREKKGVAAEGR